jgi:signal transduction histidine kinase
MRKVALVFVLAVFVPSLVLAWLAFRSLRDQQFVVERQQSLLYQAVTDSLARNVNDALAERQREFNASVESVVASGTSATTAANFDELIRSNWPLAEVGFCVTLTGNLLSPSPLGPPVSREFYTANCTFLGNKESAEVYWNALSLKGQNLDNNSYIAQQQSQSAFSNSKMPSSTQSDVNVASDLQQKSPNIGKAQNRKVTVQQAQSSTMNNEQPMPDLQSVSKIVPSEAEFAQLVGDSREGMIARFLQNKLNVMFWRRSTREPQLIFGAQLNLPRLVDQLREVVRAEPTMRDEICLVLLDDNAKPVALSYPNFNANWKHPFVATEVGEALPHWEVAAYVLNPGRLDHVAHVVRLTLGLLIAVLVLAIGIGSWLIVTDLNRQLALARQKTDFVSNVSHELKTPLTSIRMFSELLAEGRVADPAKQRSYLHIITAEAARLTRLINNVLDFARLERGEKKYNFATCDLAAIVRDAADSYRPHLENNGFNLECELPPGQLPVRGDGDALAQIIVNLLSNSEKYSGDKKDIAVQVARREGPLPCAEVKVLDRGPGVPRGSEEKIFEKFYRAHDSLSSGVQGSGLGLTLARQIARAHGGDVVYETRDGGGSCFCLRLPVVQDG